MTTEQMERHPELEPTPLLTQILGVLCATGILVVVVVGMGLLGLSFGDCPRC